MSSVFNVDYIAQCADEVQLRFPENDDVEKALLLFMVRLYGVVWTDAQLAHAQSMLHDETLSDEQCIELAKSTGLTKINI